MASFEGIIPALYTCFNSDGSVNYRETVRLAEWLVKKGVGGFYLCGTTGSGLLLTQDERKRITNEVAEALAGQIPIMVHVGSMATREAIELAEHAASFKGVAGISSLPPQYYPLPFEDEIENLSVIAGATNLPFYPYLFGSLVDKYGIDKLIKGFSEIPNMAGVKAFVSDLSVHQLLITRSPETWQIFHGFDQCLLPALAITGVNAAIGSTYNVVPELAIAIYDAAKNGDFKTALLLNQKFGSYWISIHGFSFLEFGRYFLQERGFQMGQPRAPLRCPSKTEIEIVKHRMESYGFKLNSFDLV